MRHLKKITLAALVALGVVAFTTATTASATTLEVNGTTKSESVEMTISLKPGTSSITRDTFGFSANTCTSSHLAWATDSPFTGSAVTGAISELTFSNCQHSVTVDWNGWLRVEWTSDTNGRVYSEGAEVTEYSALHGTYMTCRTSEAGTLIGTLTGVASGHATLHVNATINCGEHLSSAKWLGTYIVTTPTGLGVSA